MLKMASIQSEISAAIDNAKTPEQFELFLQFVQGTAPRRIVEALIRKLRNDSIFLGKASAIDPPTRKAILNVFDASPDLFLAHTHCDLLNFLLTNDETGNSNPVDKFIYMAMCNEVPCPRCLQTFEDASHHFANRGFKWTWVSGGVSRVFRWFIAEDGSVTPVPDIILAKITHVLRMLNVCGFVADVDVNIALDYIFPTPPRFWDQRVLDAIEAGGFPTTLSSLEFYDAWEAWPSDGFEDAVVKFFPTSINHEFEWRGIMYNDYVDCCSELLWEEGRDGYEPPLLHVLRAVYKYKPDISGASVTKGEQRCIKEGINLHTDNQATFLVGTRCVDSSVSRFVDNPMFDLNLISAIFSLMDNKERAFAVSNGQESASSSSSERPLKRARTG